MRAFRLPGDRAKALAFAADGRLLAGTAGGQVLTLDPRGADWELATGWPSQWDRDGPIRFLADTPEGIVAQDNDELWIRDRRLANHVWHAAAAPDGVAVAWLAKSPPEVLVLRTDTPGSAVLYARPSELAVAAGGRLVAGAFYRTLGATAEATGPDALVRVWDVTTGLRAADRVLKGVGLLGPVAFAPDGRALAVAARRQVEVIAVPAGDLVLRVEHGRSQSRVWVRHLAWHPSGRSLATAGDSGAVTVWDADDGRERAVYGTDALAVEKLAFAPDGLTLAVLTGGGAEVVLFDIDG